MGSPCSADSAFLKMKKGATTQKGIPGGIPLLSGVVICEFGQVRTATGNTPFGTDYCHRLSRVPGAWLPERERRSLNSAR